MQIGVTIFPTAETIGMGELAVAVEERGFESLFVPEHTHVPLQTVTDFPGEGSLPEHYARLLDPFVALTTAAASTTTLKIGTAVCLVVQHDPIILAKTAATLDLVSAGRFIFGVGGGWSAEEMHNHGIDPTQRWQLMREKVEAISTIWAQDEAAYHGELISFEALRCWPKPVQTPRPGIHVGGWATGSMDRAIAYGDGWMPAAVVMRSPDFFEGLVEFRRRAAEAGRDNLEVSCYSAPPDSGFFARLRDVEVDRAILSLPSSPRDDVLRVLDSYAGLFG
jgi:probable F420-dependent oxidoreductase